MEKIVVKKDGTINKVIINVNKKINSNNRKQNDNICKYYPNCLYGNKCRYRHLTKINNMDTFIGINKPKIIYDPNDHDFENDYEKKIIEGYLRKFDN